MVAESKIKKLQTENEALKLHLKLAIDSLKNPIPPVQLKDKESDEEDDDDEYDYDSESTAADDELQHEMERYLQDMGNLRKLIGGDLSRFKDTDSVRMPLGSTNI
ncbi:hypothetical protein M440DRAFT_1178119, partial [Trichoderma longibrachiatum ATCC 18648]